MTTATTSSRTSAVPFILRLFVFEVVITASFGLLLLLAPQPLLELLGVEPAPAVVLLARLFGTGLIYVAFLHAWQCRVRSEPAMRSLLWANILQDMLAATVLMIGTLQGTLNVLGWLMTAVFAMVVVLNVVSLRVLPEGER
jgi:hypothetical protein